MSDRPGTPTPGLDQARRRHALWVRLYGCYGEGDADSTGAVDSPADSAGEAAEDSTGAVVASTVGALVPPAGLHAAIAASIAAARMRRLSMVSSKSAGMGAPRGEGSRAGVRRGRPDPIERRATPMSPHARAGVAAG